MAETFLVTGATGKTSELVATALVEQGANVRALVRDVTKAAALRAKGAQLCLGDFDQPETLVRALDGVTSVFLVTPPNPDDFGMVERFLAAATKSPMAPRTYVQITPEQTRQMVLQSGGGEWFAGILADYALAYGKGWGNFTTSFVQKITGRQARSVSQFAREVFAPALMR